MTRKGFFAVLGSLGILKAQQWKECTSGVPGTTAYATNLDHCWVKYQKPEPALNGQCPVCGTMADAYKRPMRAPKMIPDGPIERVVRCRRCNAAFFQNSEGASSAQAGLLEPKE
jgi:hypothetical protein